LKNTLCRLQIPASLGWSAADFVIKQRTIIWL
jgi:hypothetical protein